MKMSRDLWCWLDWEQKCCNQNVSKAQCAQDVSCKHFASFPRARLRKEVCGNQSLQATEWEVGEVKWSTKALGLLPSAEKFQEIRNKGWHPSSAVLWHCMWQVSLAPGNSRMCGFGGLRDSGKGHGDGALQPQLRMSQFCSVDTGSQMLLTWNFALGDQFFKEQQIDLCVLHFEKELHEVIVNNICKIIHLMNIKIVFSQAVFSIQDYIVANTTGFLWVSIPQSLWMWDIPWTRVLESSKNCPEAHCRNV